MRTVKIALCVAAAAQKSALFFPSSGVNLIKIQEASKLTALLLATVRLSSNQSLRNIFNLHGSPA
jgi:hypothetical protein